MTRVLVVEDDPSIRRGLVMNLETEGYEVSSTADGADGYRLVQDQSPDLVVLDLMLPSLSGYELCKKLRDEGSTVPIIMLTARGEESDRVLGLDLGADDYVTKPFSVRELMARIRAVLRRTNAEGALPDDLRFDDVEIDFLGFEARKSGVRIEMTRKEFGLLRYLVARSGEVVTRDELLDEVWGYKSYPESRTVDNHIANLRGKVEADPTNPRYLITVRGVGYKWLPQRDG
ncbi:MAG: response regulator transcription factor [Acidobacteria bacterium]|nr:response regulator transcription factor [Acidobacteriota bacterium]